MYYTFTFLRRPSGRLLLAILFYLNSGISQSQVPVLWSCSTGGGRNGFGTIFKINADGTHDTVLHHFELQTGGQPAGGMISGDNGKFYGACTFQGAINQSGAIFSFDPDSRVYTDLFDFDYTAASGGLPYENIVQAPNGVLYGTNSQDNGTGFGIIYAFNPANSQYQSVFQFNPLTYSNGKGPMLASDGKIYGTIQPLSNCYAGIYCINPATNAITMYPFDTTGHCMNGKQPEGGLTEAEPGILYGTCKYGGDNNGGTIFSFNMQTHAINRLFSLDSVYGIRPDKGAMTMGHDGKVYGVTVGGGTHNAGVIYSIDTATHAFTKLADFNDTLGVTPLGSMLLASDGKLYGTTSTGGNPGGDGTIFSFDRNTHQIRVIKNLHSTDSIGYGVTPFIEYGTRQPVTGILKAEEPDMAFHLFPNPAQNFVSVSIAQGLREKAITVADITGKILYKSIIGVSTFKIDCSDWGAGFYFVNIQGSSHTQKLVIAR